MPRPRKTQPAQRPVVPTNALVASAHRYGGKVPRVYMPSKEWQKRAYHHYSVCGEARFAARYFGHAMSRAVLYVEGQDGTRLEEGPAFDALQDLFNGGEGQTEMLERVGVHLTVGGECYLVGESIDNIDVWETLSTLEVQGGTSGWQKQDAETSVWVPIPEDAVIIRVWVSKPDARWEADSPFRSMLPVLDEIEWVSRSIQSQNRSRLTGAGLLVMPDGITFPPPPAKEGEEQVVQNDAHGFTLVLGETMQEALKGDGSAAEEVPIIVTAPGEHIGDIRHITFWSPLDENAREMRRDAISRFALGMDLPPEMVLGMSSNDGTGGGNSNGVSHWGAWMLEEQTIKLHIEPMLDVLRTALTTYYLRPLVPDSTDIVRADTTALKLRPDRSAESIELADRGWLKNSVAVRENGFQPEDMPDETERREWLLMKIASGSATPEQVQAALTVLGIDLPVTPEVPGEVIDVTEQPRETPPPPSLEEHPARPRTPAESALLPAYEALVLRALERAGNRLRNIHQIKTAGPSFEAHTHIEANGSSEQCLEDAWATAPLVLGDESEPVVACLNDYCLALLTTGTAHSREHLSEWLVEKGVL